MPETCTYSGISSSIRNIFTFSHRIESISPVSEEEPVLAHPARKAESTIVNKKGVLSISMDINQYKVMATRNPVHGIKDQHVRLTMYMALLFHGTLSL